MTDQRHPFPPAAGEAPAPPPPPPPEFGAPETYGDVEGEEPSGSWGPFARLDAAFPPHSRRRLLLLLAATPVIAGINVLRGEGGFWLWLVLSLGVMAIVGAAWIHARREHEDARTPNGGSDTPPPVIADRSRTSPLRLLAPFIGSFVGMLALTVALDPSAGDRGMTVMMSAGAAIFFGLVWHLRGTLAGLILVSLALGACVAFAGAILHFIFSLWGSGDGFNFWAWWLASSLFVGLCLWPFWRSFRRRPAPSPLLGTVAAAAVLAVSTVAVIEARNDRAFSQATAPMEQAAPDDPARAPTSGPAGAPAGAATADSAAARLFAAWRFQNRQGAEQVASEQAVEALFAIAPTDRDRVLGCGAYAGSGPECRIQSTNAGVLRLTPHDAGNGNFFIGAVERLDS